MEHINLKAPRDCIGITLIEITKLNNKVIVLNSDLEPALRLIEYKNKFPENLIQVGCAEQNMTSVAGGLSVVGFIPFITTFSCFIRRSLDQLFVSIIYPCLNVKIIGVYVGIFNGKNGATHQSLNDIAILRSLPNITILSPSDYVETIKCIEYSYAINGPVYIRVERDNMPVLFDYNNYINIDKQSGKILKQGKDIVIFSTGFMTHLALNVANKLEKEGINIKLVNIVKLKPLDEDFILKCAKNIRFVITCENHDIHGGFGSMIAEVFSKKEPKNISFFGSDDVILESADNEDLLKKYNLDSYSLEKLCRENFERAINKKI